MRRRNATRVTERARHRPFTPKPAHAAVIAVLACWQVEMQASTPHATPVQAAAQRPALIEFDPAQLRGGQATDLSRFNLGNAIDPGQYSPEVYVNGQWLGRMDLRFTPAAGQANAQPCLDRALLERTGIDMARLAPGAADPGNDCIRMEQAVPDATAVFDLNNLRLNLGIPQAALLRQASGYVSPDQWSEGASVGRLGYRFNTYHSRSAGMGNRTTSYLGLDSGLNLGGWYFRHNGSLSWSDRGNRRYQSINAYVKRNLVDWSSQLVIGDTYTDGDLADAVSFRGLRLQTDDRMLPESQRGYAPVVRGVANSNARVTIQQGGIKLYETTVAPGAFVIDDLFPTGYGGDLQVSITEADGSVRSFSVPYAAVPRSLREGQHRYSLTAGLVRRLPDSAPFFSQATWQYGASNSLTAYGGATVAQGYLSPTAGAVFNTSWGAFGLDLTHATTRLPHQPSQSGQSLRASYAKSLPQTGTHLTLAAYRYSTRGFFSLNDAMLARDRTQAGQSSDGLYRPRNRTSLSLSQSLGQTGGHLSATASVANYWQRPGTDLNYTIGYNNTWGQIPYNLSASRQRDAWGRSSTMLYAGLSIPLGSERPALLSSSLSRDALGRTRAQSSVSGALGSDNRLYYGLNADYSNGSSGSGGSGAYGGANLTYRGTQAEWSGSLSAGGGTQQFSIGARGAVVAHPGGITLSQPLGETFGIVQAKHAQGVKIANAWGVEVDARGYAVVPYLTPYRVNEVVLDPKGMSIDVELQGTSQRVVPQAGASPLLVFKTAISRSAVIRSQQEDGSPVPFGATISDASGKDLGVVGQAGKLLLRGLQDQGELRAQWKTKAGPASCDMAYVLPERQSRGGSQVPPNLALSCLARATDAPPSLAQAQPSRPTAIAPRDRHHAAERRLGDLRLSTRINPPSAAQASRDAAGPADALAQTHGHPAPALRLERLLPDLAQTLISALRNSNA